MEGSKRGCLLLEGEFHRDHSPNSSSVLSLGLNRWLISFSTFGYASSFGVYQDLYTVSGASTASNISWIGSLQLSFMFMLGIVSGRLLDAGYFHHIMAFGSLLYIFS